jgi:hypothetical protein
MDGVSTTCCCATGVSLDAVAAAAEADAQKELDLTQKIQRLEVRSALLMLVQPTQSLDRHLTHKLHGGKTARTGQELAAAIWMGLSTCWRRGRRRLGGDA